VDQRAHWWQKITKMPFFLAGREKNAPGADFSDKEVEAIKIIAKALESANSRKLEDLLASEILKEIYHEQQKND